MIYLLKSANYYKIGSAVDVEARMKQYATHNPDFELIDTKEGTNKDELILHRLCEKYHEKLEWFTYCPEVKNIWDLYFKIKSLWTKYDIIPEPEEHIKVRSIVRVCPDSEEAWNQMLTCLVNDDFVSPESIEILESVKTPIETKQVTIIITE